MWSADFTVPIAAKVICAQGIDGYENDGRCVTGCRRVPGKVPQYEKEKPSPKK